MENTSALGGLGKKVIAWLVVAAVAIIALKLIVGAVIGLVTFILTIVLVIALIMAVLWALRHL